MNGTNLKKNMKDKYKIDNDKWTSCRRQGQEQGRERGQRTSRQGALVSQFCFVLF